MSDRKGRKEELLKAARKRLTEEAKKARVDPEADSGPQIMYRGQVVKPSGGSTRAKAPGDRDARAALEKVKALYHDGLITRAEAEAKRAEILDQL